MAGLFIKRTEHSSALLPSVNRIDSTVTKLSSSPLSKLGEFGLISRIAGRVSGHESVVTGIGDDAAVTALSTGMQLLTSTDMLLEDVHFRRAWHDPYRLGRKSLAVSISDIAAMGGIPRWALLSLAIPAGLSLDFIDDFMRGFLGMAAENQVFLIGGDTCSSRSGLTLSVTIMGEQYPDLIVRRSGALPDDDIWVTGTLGDAALGLKVAEEAGSCRPAGDTSSLCCPPGPPGLEGPDTLLSRLLDPTPRVAVGRLLAEAGLVSAMVDISDGVLADFGHIAEQSGVGGCIRIDDLPLSVDFRSQTAALAAIPYQLALSGGEDYELCFTACRSNREKIIDCVKKSGIAVTRIGIVSSSLEVTAVSFDGRPYNNGTDGFNHFT
ncbi:MAG: thiamine-phosphate kinase [Desulfuromonadaceae bacterium]|nr:thiamine-phosphate kinase [Desulfuromonadaceae bacterium]MDD2847486.1 thiamine-phosphate kinase [Desulfuromonadaceae bacterium]MDD4131401.1 thiamine-phosphate kinase [Desulfuromonadaceae bacterium]